jgi:hypothetical protein
LENGGRPGTGERHGSRWIFRCSAEKMRVSPKIPLLAGANPMARLSPSLTPEQQVEADRIYTALVAAADEDIRALATQMATTTDATIFGPNEFTLRDVIQRVAAKGLEIALEGRKKGGTTGPAEPARGAANRPGSSGGRRKRS